MKSIILLTVLLVGCVQDRHFWYPVKKLEANCSTYKGEVYLMINSVGWRTWPYYLHIASRTELMLGADCTFRVVANYGKHKARGNRSIESQLTDLQRNNIIGGFR